MSLLRNATYPLLVFAVLWASYRMAAGAEIPGDEIASDRHASAKGACTTGESWRFGILAGDAIKQFEGGISASASPITSFSDALAMRRSAMSDEAKTLAEYWVSRSLYHAKLPHIAHNGFSVIAARELDRETAGIQFAALGCLLRLHDEHPALALPAPVTARLGEYLKYAQHDAEKQVTWEALGALLRSQIADPKLPEKEMERTLALLSGSGIQQTFGQALLASRRGDHPTAIKSFRAFFAESSPPQSLRKFTDQARILLARSLYSAGDHKAATEQYKHVKKSSNELAVSLSELTWAYLMNDQHSEAIGTALNLQAGGLRHTFAPEAPMVMAMALNELCQYPESVRAMNVFKRHYEAPYAWLNSWANATGADRPNLYRHAVAHLRKKSSVPDKVASEWVRSPLFLSAQEEINLLFDERDSSKTLGKLGAQEQRLTAQQVVTLARDLKPRFAAARAKQKPGEQLPSQIREDLVKLRRHWTHFQRLKGAAPVWRTLLASHSRQIPKHEARLASLIEADLETRTHRMLFQLEEIATNLQLIEVEIYQGASDDIIWQNAHPEYKKVAKDLDPEKDLRPASKVWDWGRSPAAMMDGGEIWEDELGSFKANLFDNCSSKDRYLALAKIKQKKSAAAAAAAAKAAENAQGEIQ